MKGEHDMKGGDINSGSLESFNVIRCYNGLALSSPHDLVAEEPLMIRVDGRSYATIMRTPGEETFHAAGFCLAEGIVDGLTDLASIEYGDDGDVKTVDVVLSPERRKRRGDVHGQETLVSLTSSGIFGREPRAERPGLMVTASDGPMISADVAITQIERLGDLQALHRETWGSHAAMILDSGLRTLSISEDVGRHNALDKAIGRLLMNNMLELARVCVLTSRISYEMVIKTNRARIPMILSASRPTALAVRLGRSLNMTLACAARKSELIIFTGDGRIKR